MAHSDGGHRMPGDLRRNRLVIPPCPDCGGPEVKVIERNVDTLTLECASCGFVWEVDKPRDSW